MEPKVKDKGDDITMVNIESNGNKSPEREIHDGDVRMAANGGERGVDGLHDETGKQSVEDGLGKEADKQDHCDTLVDNGIVYYEADWRDPTSTSGTGSDPGDGKGGQQETLVGKGINFLQRGILFLWRSVMTYTKGYLLNALLLLSYIVYFIIAMTYEKLENEGSIRLLVCTIIGAFVVTRGYWTLAIKEAVNIVRTKGGQRAIRLQTGIRWFMYAVLLGVIVWVVVDQGIKDTRNLRPVPGLFLMMLVCLCLSAAPSCINWHTIYWSLGLQFIVSLLVLKWEAGRDAMEWTQDRFSEFFANTVKGSVFVFGREYYKHNIVFGAFPTLLFTNAALALLYHAGAMQLIIKAIGTFLRFVLGTTHVESTGVAASIFLDGPTSLISIRPYLGMLTKSQLFLLSTAVYSSLGGTYIGILGAMKVRVADIIPAMIISAPATFAICKLLIPETGNNDRHIELDAEKPTGNGAPKKSTSVLEVVRIGAIELISALTHVVAIVFVFYSFLSWINHTLTWFGDRVGIDRFTLEIIFSYILYPLAFFMGVEGNDCRRVAMLLGYRIGGNTLIAFEELTKMKINRAVFDAYMNATATMGPYSHEGDDIIIANDQRLILGFINERSERIVTYSLCGFSSIVSIGINIGVLAVLIPRRKEWLSKTSGLALIAGNLANCMTGAFAGLFYYN